MLFFGIFILVAGVFFALPSFAILDSIADGLIAGMTWLLLTLSRLAIGMTVFLLRFFITLASYNDFINASVVKLGWVMVRDVANMFFVVILLVIAFATILGIEQYEWKKSLVKLILAAVFINFSNVIAQLFIDAAHVFTITFLNAISATAGGNIINMFKLDEMMRFVGGQDASNADNLQIELLGGAFIAFVFALIAMVTLAAYVVIMLLRVVLLWTLIILSPIAYVTQVLPNTQHYAQRWWKEFSQEVMVAPLMVFFLWLAFATLGHGEIIQRDFTGDTVIPLQQVNTDEEFSLSLSKVSTWENMANFFIAIVFLYIGIKEVSESGAAGANLVNKAVDFGKKIGTIASGYALGRWMVGGAAKGAWSVAKKGGKAALWKMPVLGGEKFANRFKNIGHSIVGSYRELGMRMSPKGEAARESLDKLYKRKEAGEAKGDEKGAIQQNAMREIDRLEGVKQKLGSDISPEQTQSLDKEIAEQRQILQDATIGINQEDLAALDQEIKQQEKVAKSSFSGGLLGRFSRSGIELEKQTEKSKKQAEVRKEILWKRVGSEAGGQFMAMKEGTNILGIPGTQGIKNLIAKPWNSVMQVGMGTRGLFGTRWIGKMMGNKTKDGKGVGFFGDIYAGREAQDRIERGWLAAEKMRSEAKDKDYEGRGKNEVLSKPRLKYNVKTGKMSYESAAGTMMERIQDHTLTGEKESNKEKRMQADARLRVSGNFQSVQKQLEPVQKDMDKINEQLRDLRSGDLAKSIESKLKTLRQERDGVTDPVEREKIEGEVSELEAQKQAMLSGDVLTTAKGKDGKEMTAKQLQAEIDALEFKKSNFNATAVEAQAGIDAGEDIVDNQSKLEAARKQMDQTDEQLAPLQAAYNQAAGQEARDKVGAQIAQKRRTLDPSEMTPERRAVLGREIAEAEIISGELGQTDLDAGDGRSLYESRLMENLAVKQAQADTIKAKSWTAPSKMTYDEFLEEQSLAKLSSDRLSKQEETLLQTRISEKLAAATEADATAGRVESGAYTDETTRKRIEELTKGIKITSDSLMTKATEQDTNKSEKERLERQNRQHQKDLEQITGEDEESKDQRKALEAVIAQNKGDIDTLADAITKGQTEIANLLENKTGDRTELDSLKKDLRVQADAIRKGDSGTVRGIAQNLTEQGRLKEAAKLDKVAADMDAGGATAWQYGVAASQAVEANRVYKYRHNLVLSDAEQRVIWDKRGVDTPKTTLTELIEEFEKGFSEMSYGNFVASAGDMLLKAVDKVQSGDLQDADRAALMGLFKRGFNESWVDDVIISVMSNSEARGQIGNVLGWKDMEFSKDKIRDVEMMFASGGDLTFARNNVAVSEVLDAGTKKLGMDVAGLYSGMKTGKFVDTKGNVVNNSDLKKEVMDSLVEQDRVLTGAQQDLLDLLLEGENAEVEARRREVMDKYTDVIRSNQSSMQFLGNLRNDAIKKGHGENAGWALMHDIGGGKKLYVPSGVGMASDNVLSDANKTDTRLRAGAHPHATMDLDEDNGQVATRLRTHDDAIMRNGIIDFRTWSGTTGRYIKSLAGIAASDQLYEYKDEKTGFFKVGASKGAQSTWMRKSGNQYKRAMAGKSKAQQAQIQEALTARNIVRELYVPKMHSNMADFLLTMAATTGMSQPEALKKGAMELLIPIYDETTGSVEKKKITTVDELIGMVRGGKFGPGLSAPPSYKPPAEVLGLEDER